MASESKLLERITAWSTFATAAIAVIALVFAWMQLQSAAASQREATAQETFREYLNLAIEKPNLAEGLREMPSDQLERAEYSWFVSYVLHSSEQILLVRPGDQEWTKAIASQLCYHTAFFADKEWTTSLREHYSEVLVNLVTASLQQCGSK